MTFSILSEKSHHFLNIIEKRETLIIISHVILVTLDFNKFLPNYNHKYENVGMPLFIKTLCGIFGTKINIFIRKAKSSLMIPPTENLNRKCYEVWRIIRKNFVFKANFEKFSILFRLSRLSSNLAFKLDLIFTSKNITNSVLKVKTCMWLWMAP